MLVFDLTVEFTVGATFALAHRERLIAPDVKPLQDRAFRNGLLYSGFLYIASAVFFLVGWPAWNSMYLFDLSNPVHMAWFAYADTAALLACFVAGYIATVGWLRRAKGFLSPTGLRLAALWAAVCAVLFIWLWDRSFTVTTYADFLAHARPRFALRWGQPDSFFGHALMYWLLVWMVLDFGPLLFIYREARIAAKNGPTRF